MNSDFFLSTGLQANKFCWSKRFGKHCTQIDPISIIFRIAMRLMASLKINVGTKSLASFYSADIRLLLERLELSV